MKTFVFIFFLFIFFPAETTAREPELRFEKDREVHTTGNLTQVEPAAQYSRRKIQSLENEIKEIKKVLEEIRSQKGEAGSEFERNVMGIESRFASLEQELNQILSQFDRLEDLSARLERVEGIVIKDNFVLASDYEAEISKFEERLKKIEGTLPAAAEVTAKA